MSEVSETHQDKQQAFMLLYEPCNQRLSSYCRAQCKGNVEDAKDLMSETILKAYEAFERLRNKDVFLYFLFGIACNIQRNRNRRKKFVGEYTDQFANNLHDKGAAPDAGADLHILYDALNRLPAKQCEALVLYEISGFSLKEIQEIQGEQSLSAIKSRVARAREKMASMLGAPARKQELKMAFGTAVLMAFNFFN
jgi:RNA polymerase sigma-70 factor, ECF subfamily